MSIAKILLFCLASSCSRSTSPIVPPERAQVTLVSGVDLFGKPRCVDAAEWKQFTEFGLLVERDEIATSTRFEEPVRRAAMSVDANPVTCEEYQLCKEAGKCTGMKCHPSAHYASQPVDHATEFCLWRHGRLPTIAELEAISAGWSPCTSEPCSITSKIGTVHGDWDPELALGRSDCTHDQFGYRILGHISFKHKEQGIFLVDLANSRGHFRCVFPR